MSLSIDKLKLDNLANEIWKSAERLRGKFKAIDVRKQFEKEPKFFGNKRHRVTNQNPARLS